MRNLFSSVLLPYSFSYLLFFTILLLCSLKKANRLVVDDNFTKQPTLLLLLHLAGIFLFGTVPFFSRHVSAPAIFSFANLRSWITGLSVFATLFTAIISLRLARGPGSEGGSSVKTKISAAFLSIYFPVRIAFIVSYEIWFRGFLITDCIEIFGLIAAVSLNILLYALLHIVNGRKEMIGCIPFGLLLSFLCMWQQAVWPAVAVHLALTISYEAVFVKKMRTKLSSYDRFNNRRFRLYRE